MHCFHVLYTFLLSPVDKLVVFCVQVLFGIHKDMGFADGDKSFHALQLHFHWGRAKLEDGDIVWSKGSEHTVNGLHYPIEVYG